MSEKTRPHRLSLLPNAAPDAVRVPCAIYRGGASRAVFFMASDVPPPGSGRDAFLLKVMGSPHVRQIDGLGGAHPATSKAAIVGPSARKGCHVDCTFAQVDIEQARVDYSGLCGNISAAVGPFAIDSGLVAATGELTTVNIHATNINGMMRAFVPTHRGQVVQAGDYTIDGAPGSGAKILLDYSRAAGSLTGSLLPTGRSVDEIEMEDGSRVAITICDMVNPVVFVSAQSLHATGFESPAQIEADERLIARQREVRGAAAKMMGLVDHWRDADRLSPVKPYLIMVAPPRDADIDVQARVIFMNRSHESMTGSGAPCLAVASRIAGSVVEVATRRRAASAESIRIGHPSGSMDVEIVVDRLEGGGVEVKRAGIGRTARLILEGSVFV